MDKNRIFSFGSAVITVGFLAVNLMMIYSGREAVRKADAPGEITEGIFMDPEGRFTLQTDEALWEITESEGIEAIQLKDDPEVMIRFQPIRGLDDDMIRSFELTYAVAYMRDLAAFCPETKLKRLHNVSDRVAGLEATTLCKFTGKPEYQCLYLASDGENGYRLEAFFPEPKAEKLAPEIRTVIESIAFTGKKEV